MTSRGPGCFVQVLYMEDRWEQSRTCLAIFFSICSQFSSKNDASPAFLKQKNQANYLLSSSLSLISLVKFSQDSGLFAGELRMTTLMNKKKC